MATSLDCLAQPAGSGPASTCCKHAPCKKSPGQTPHSSCQIQPSGPETLAPPQSVDWAPAPPPVAVQRLDPPIRESVIFRSMATRVPTDSPPDVFLWNSSFLI